MFLIESAIETNGRKITDIVLSHWMVVVLGNRIRIRQNELNNIKRGEEGTVALF